MEVIVEECKYIDLVPVSKVHRELFSDHLLGMLPVKLIQRFYACHLNENKIFLCAKCNNEIVGFILGGRGRDLADSKKIFLKKYFIRFGVNILIRPKALRLFWKTYIKKDLNKSNESFSCTPYRLLSIGVRNDFQGKGVSQHLLSEFESQLDKDVLEYGLSVHSDNIKAIKFYLKMKFEKEYENQVSIFFRKTNESNK